MYKYENSLAAGVAGRASNPKGDLEVARAIIVDKTDVETIRKITSNLEQKIDVAM